MSFRLVVVCACLLLSACLLRPYRIDVQQGNYIDREVISKLKAGMTRAQVKFLLGTPLIVDPFTPNRWDYLYYNRPSGKIKDVHRLTLYFEGDRLERALADTAVAPLPGQSAANETTAAAAATSAPPSTRAAPVPASGAQDSSAATLPSTAPAAKAATTSPTPARSAFPPGRDGGTQ